MTETEHDTPARDALPLGRLLRGLRRRADLSQRELAERACVPPTTVARIESGCTWDPRFRTVERLVRAAGARLAVAGPGERDSLDDPDPHGDLRDLADRRYPAHLDVRPVIEPGDWWGNWWAGWYWLPRRLWPREAPPYSFDLSRRRRDWRRNRGPGR